MKDRSLPPLDLGALQREPRPDPEPLGQDPTWPRFLWTVLFSIFIATTGLGLYMGAGRLEFSSIELSGASWLLWLASLFGLLVWCAYYTEYRERRLFTLTFLALYVLLNASLALLLPQVNNALVS